MAFLGINQFRQVGLRFVCWFYDGNTRRLTESGFMEKLGIELATTGLQDLGGYWLSQLSSAGSRGGSGGSFEPPPHP